MELQPEVESRLLRTSTLILLSTSGALYVASAWYRDALLSLLGLPVSLDAQSFVDQGAMYMGGQIAIQLPSLALILWAMRGDQAARARLHPLGTRFRVLIVSMAVTVIVRVSLDSLGWWPWVWRWRPGAFGFVATTLELRAWLTGALLILWAGVLIPFIEEAAFRVTLNDVVIKNGAGEYGGVFTTSLVFTALHFGPSFHPQGSLLVHGIWLFIFSVILGSVTLRSHGQAAAAMWIHAALNGVEQLMAFLLAIRNS